MSVNQKGISAIRIYDADDRPVLVVPINDQCKRQREIMKEDCLKLQWESAEYMRLEAGFHVYYGTNALDKQNPPFFLLNPYEPTHKSETLYVYEPKFHARQDLWQKYPVCVYTYTDGTKREVKSRELEWSFLGTAEDALSMVEQAVKFETGWELDKSVIGSVKQTKTTAVELSGQSTSIFEILGKIAQTLDTEWRYDEERNRIELGELRLPTDAYPTIRLRVGEDCENPSVNQNKEDYFTRFYVFGSDKNITQQMVSEITNSAVKRRLPLSSAKYPEGFMDLDILKHPQLRGNLEDGFYLPDGVVYRPKQTDKSRVYPKGLYFDDVYPSSKFYIRDIIVNGKDGKQHLVDENGKILGDTYYVALTTDGENPKSGAFWNDYSLADVLPGENLEMYWTGGILNGRKYALSAHPQYKDGNTYFYLTPDQNGALTTPNQYLHPSVGDEVTFFGYNFGDMGFANAKDNLERTATKYLAELVQSNMKFQMRCNAVRFERYAVRDTRYTFMPLGQQIVVDYGNGDVSDVLRVIKAESSLDIPSEMTLEASAKTDPKGAIGALTDTVELNRRTADNKIEEYRQQAINYANRSMTQVFETMQQINNYYGKEIKTTQTMQQIVGDESLQFVFADNPEFKPTRAPQCFYDNKEGVFRLKMFEDPDLYFYIKHMSIGITEISTEESTDKKRKIWRMRQGTAYTTWQNDEAQMVYLECPVETGKDGVYAEAVLITSSEKLELTKDGNHYLLLGFLNSPNEEGERSFVQMYGYTEILPARITTDKIVSPDGKTYFDIANGEIGGNINFRDAIMAETIFIKDGTRTTASGEPYYIGGLSGAQDLPVLFCGIDPSKTDTAEIERIAKYDPLPIKIMKKGYGSNLGCLNIVDDNIVDVNGTAKGLVRISNRGIVTENDALSPVNYPDTPWGAKSISTSINGYKGSETHTQTITDIIKTVFKADTKKQCAISLAGRFPFNLRFTGRLGFVQSKDYEIIACNVAIDTRMELECSTNGNTDTWSTLVYWKWDTINLSLKTLRGSRSFEVSDAINTNLVITNPYNRTISECRIRPKLTITARVGSISGILSTSSPYIKLSIDGTIGGFTLHVVDQNKANILADGGMTSAIDADNFFKLYPRNNRLVCGLRSVFDLQTVTLSVGESRVNLQKWGAIVSMACKIDNATKNDKALTIPKDYCPSFEMYFYCVTGNTGVSITPDGKWHYYDTFSLVYGCCMWFTEG